MKDLSFKDNNLHQPRKSISIWNRFLER